MAVVWILVAGWQTLAAVELLPVEPAELETLPTEELEAIGEQDSDYRRALIELSRRHHAANDAAAYREVLVQLERHFPGDAVARRYFASGYIRLGDWDRLAPLRQAFRLQTDEPLRMLDEAIQLAGEGNLFRSLIYLEAALRAAPDDSRILLNLGTFYCRFRNCEEGIVLLRRLTAVAPDDPYGYLALARAATALRDFAEAMEAATQGLQLAKENPVYQERVVEDLNRVIAFIANYDSEG